MKYYCPECETRYEGDEFEVCPDDGARLFRLDSPEKKGDPLIDAVIDDRFRIEDLVGTGGMGAVYRAVQLSVQREVAVKVLRPELVDREVMLERFFREAKVVSELTHPNIVRLVDFGQDEDLDVLYLVMELVQGTDLGDLISRGRLRTNLALEIVYQICGALTEPHARGIVHRDLKPENLIMMPISDGTLQIKVLDFGIARALEGGTKLTKTGMICGTPSYMSPEQAQNDDLDGRTDLYALGVMLFEMLTGRPPFMGETSLQVLLNHIQSPVPRLIDMVPPGIVPDEISALVEELMAKDPDDRPESARRVRDRIDQLRHQLELRPVRLNEEVDVRDAFDAWLLPRVELRDEYGEDSSDELEEQFSVGFGESSTGEVGEPRGHTGEMAAESKDSAQSGGTELEYLGVAETMAAAEAPTTSEGHESAAGEQALRRPDSGPNPTPSTGGDTSSMPATDGADNKRRQQPAQTGNMDPAPTPRAGDSATEVNSAVSGQRSDTGPSPRRDTQTAPGMESTDAGARDILTNPLVIGLGALLFLMFSAVVGVVGFYIVGGFDDEDADEQVHAQADEEPSSNQQDEASVQEVFARASMEVADSIEQATEEATEETGEADEEDEVDGTDDAVAEADTTTSDQGRRDESDDGEVGSAPGADGDRAGDDDPVVDDGGGESTGGSPPEPADADPRPEPESQESPEPDEEPKSDEDQEPEPPEEQPEPVDEETSPQTDDGDDDDGGSELQDRVDQLVGD